MIMTVIKGKLSAERLERAFTTAAAIHKARTGRDAQRGDDGEYRINGETIGKIAEEAVAQEELSTHDPDNSIHENPTHDSDLKDQIEVGFSVKACSDYQIENCKKDRSDKMLGASWLFDGKGELFSKEEEVPEGKEYIQNPDNVFFRSGDKYEKDVWPHLDDYRIVLVICDLEGNYEILGYVTFGVIKNKKFHKPTDKGIGHKKAIFLSDIESYIKEIDESFYRPVRH